MMTNNNTNPGKVEVNGDAPALDPTLRNQITLALSQNGGVKRIESKLREGLDEAGWSQAVREYATALLRSGDAVTFDDLERNILQNIDLDGTIEASTKDLQAPDLTVPRSALVRGADQVKKELREIVEFKK